MRSYNQTDNMQSAFENISAKAGKNNYSHLPSSVAQRETGVVKSFKKRGGEDLWFKKKKCCGEK